MSQAEISSRKGEHIKLCLDSESQGKESLFPGVNLPYAALPEINLDDVSTAVNLFGSELSQPLIISSMTGGTEHGNKINTNLAIAAQASQVALGVGSQRIGLENPEAAKSFEVFRRHAPSAFILANMGAIQLNNGYGVDHYRKVIEMVQADAIYLHINPLQEALQPGGDSNYAGLLSKITDLVKRLDVPVFIKEVGHGIDLKTAQALIDAGVAGIDVAGVGGTSYAWVEAKRANNNDFAEWFKDLGITTEQSIRAIAPIKGSAKLVASGGIRSPIEGYKAHLIGADLYASTRPFLQAALVSSDAVNDVIENWQRGLRVAMFATGTASW